MQWKRKTFLDAASTRGFSCQPSRESGWERREATVRVDWLIVSLEKTYSYKHLDYYYLLT